MGMTHALTVFVVKDAPFSLIIGIPAMKTMKIILDFEKDITIFRSEEKVKSVLFWTDKEHDGRLLSEEFIYEENDDTDEESNEESE